MGTSAAASVHETLGIRTVEVSPDRVVLELDIGPRVHQYQGMLHGGVSAILAESAASMGALANCDPEAQQVLGVDISVSHLRGRSEGVLRATAEPARKGRSLHVWSVTLSDAEGVSTAVALCTIAIRPLRTEDRI